MIRNTINLFKKSSQLSKNLIRLNQYQQFNFSFLDRYTQAEQLFKQKDYTKAQDELYELEKEFQDLDIQRLKVLNLLAQTELESGNIDQANIFNEEAINIYHINNQAQSGKQKDQQYYLDLLQFARSFTVRINVLGKQQDDNLMVPLIQQCQDIYRECYDNIQEFETKDQSIIRQELALTLTKQSLKFIQTQKFDQCSEKIEESLNIWKEVENYEQKSSYNYTKLVYGMAQIMKKNFEQGTVILNEVRDSIDESTFQNVNMANLYMGSLCVLSQVYKSKDQSKYKQIMNDFDRALELLGKNADKNAQMLFQQYKAFRSQKL